MSSLGRFRRIGGIVAAALALFACFTGDVVSAHRGPAPSRSPASTELKLEPSQLLISLKIANPPADDENGKPSGAMVQILQVADSAIAAAGEKGTDCQKAAANIAFQAVFDAYTGGILGGFIDAIKGALTNIFNLGKKGLEDYIGDKLQEGVDAAKEAFKEWLKEQVEGKPPETNTWPFTKGKCTGTVKSTWDIAAGTYTVIVDGKCQCNPVATGGLRSAQLDHFTVTVTGKVSIDLDYKERMPILHVDPTPKVTVEAHCESCSQPKSTKQPEQPMTPLPPATPGDGGGTANLPPRVPEAPEECNLKPPCPECMSIYDQIVAACKRAHELIDEMNELTQQFARNQADQRYAQTQLDQLKAQNALESQIAAQTAELTALQQEAKNLILTSLNDGIELQALQATLTGLAKQLAECQTSKCGPKSAAVQPPSGTTLQPVPPNEPPKATTPESPVGGTGGVSPPQGPTVPPAPPLPPRTQPSPPASSPIVPGVPLPACWPAGTDVKAACQTWLNIAQRNQLAADLAAKALASAQDELDSLNKAAQDWANHAQNLKSASDAYLAMSQADAAKAAAASNPDAALPWQKFSQDAAAQSVELAAEARQAQAQADALNAQAKLWAEKVAAAKADLEAKQAAAAASLDSYNACLHLPACTQTGQAVTTTPPTETPVQTGQPTTSNATGNTQQGAASSGTGMTPNGGASYIPGQAQTLKFDAPGGSITISIDPYDSHIAGSHYTLVRTWTGPEGSVTGTYTGLGTIPLFSDPATNQMYLNSIVTTALTQSPSPATPTNPTNALPSAPQNTPPGGASIAPSKPLGLAPTQPMPFTCAASVTVSPILRSEGFTELVGDILLTCKGATPTPAGNSSILLSSNAPFINPGQLQLTEPLVLGAPTIPGVMSGTSTTLYDVGSLQPLLQIDEPNSQSSTFKISGLTFGQPSGQPQEIHLTLGGWDGISITPNDFLLPLPGPNPATAPTQPAGGPTSEAPNPNAAGGGPPFNSILSASSFLLNSTNSGVNGIVIVIIQYVAVSLPASAGSTQSTYLTPPTMRIAPHDSNSRATSTARRDSGWLQLAAYHTDDPVLVLSRRGMLDPLAAEDPQAGAFGKTIYSIVANGNSSEQALELQVYDPSARIQDEQAALPEGLVLEPLKQGSAKSVAELQPGANILRKSLVAYCVEYLKLPPEPNMLYRVAPQAVQDKFAGIQQVLQAGRELADAGKFHPDSDAAPYEDSIRQYALWSKIENWDQQKFGEVFLDKTKQNALAAKVKWSKQMEQAVTGLIPGRWRDISMVLDEAARLPNRPSAPGPRSPQ